MMVSRARVCTDPTVGCFAVRRSVVEGVQLEATGWKVLLEILARGRWERYAEVPIGFGRRTWGRSKLRPGVLAAFAVQLLRLAAGDPGWGALWRFLLVGLAGVGVNLGIFVLLGSAGLGAGPAEGWAALGALIWNAAWNEFWTFAGAPGARAAHLARYLAVASVGVLMAGQMSALLQWAGAGRWLAGLGGTLASSAWNWIGASRWAWRTGGRVEHA